jgi:integrase
LIEQAAAIRDNYTYQTRHWIAWTRERGLGVNEESIREYFRFLNEESGYTAGTIRNKRQAVKKRVRQLFQNAPIEERMKIDRLLSDLDHEHDTKAPKVASDAVTEDKVLSPVEYREMLMRARTDRQRAFLRTLWDTGMRVSELTGIRLERCEVGEKVVKVRIVGKGAKERFIRIQRALYDYVRETFNGSTYLFETQGGKPYQRDYVSLQVKKMGRLIGRKVSAHSLRHSWASRKVQQLPGKLDAVSRYLGHSSTSITLNMYCHSQLSDAELFEAEAIG